MKQLLTAAQNEIHALRRRSEILSAKVDMIELFALVFNSTPARSGGGMAEDVAWKLQKEIDKITEKEKDDKGLSSALALPIKGE